MYKPLAEEDTRNVPTLRVGVSLLARPTPERDFYKKYSAQEGQMHGGRYRETVIEGPLSRSLLSAQTPHFSGACMGEFRTAYSRMS